ncbi:MAG: hypothetical protein ACHREM_09975, partial [Polyangiales bacterium]
MGRTCTTGGPATRNSFEVRPSAGRSLGSNARHGDRKACWSNDARASVGHGSMLLHPSPFARALLGFALVSFTRAANANDPLNSSDAPTNAEPATKRGARTEFNLVPIVGGSSDVGFGGGFFSELARMRPGYDPYFWSLESAGLVTFRGDGAG